MFIREQKKTAVAFAATLLVLSLAACGGGGGGSGATENWVADPPDSGTPTDGGDDGSSEESPTSSGVTVGVIDSGANTSNLALASADIQVLDYYGQGDNLSSGTVTGTDITSTDPDLSGHGTLVSEVIAGQAVGDFSGGVAPNSTLIVAKTSTGSSRTSSSTDITAALSDLYGQGVRLFNLSQASSNTYGANSWFVQIMEEVTSGGGLVVLAAGNDGAAEPSSEASLGVSLLSSDDGLIAVAGSNTDGTGLHAESNACGQAASYCISAAYESATLIASTSTDPASPSYSITTGTSLSAPLVTGTAALVWEKYPWMSNSNVQQTILTTATYLGEATSTPYNTSTGWGLLNTDMAINGPAMFYDSDFAASVSTGTYTFSNSISGNAGLQKSGVGTLVLAGTNTYTGDTAISEGELEVSGSLLSTTTLTGGTLSGSGSVASVNNTAGTVSTANGSLTIDGDYAQSSSASLNGYVGNTLGISGNASLDGTLNVKSDGSYVTAGSYNLLTTGGEISGDFSSVATDSVFLDSTTSKQTNAYVVDISQVSASSNASMTSTSAAVVSATALDTLFASADTLSAKQASGQTLSSEQESFLQTAGSIQAASTDSMAFTAAASHSGTAYAQVPSAILQAQEVIQQAAVDRVHQALNASQSHAGVWASGDYITGSTAPDGWNNADVDISGLSLGYDMAVGDNAVVGAFINQSSIETDWSDYGGKLKSTPTSLGLYGKYRFGQGYVVGLGQVQHGESDLSRYQVTTTDVTRVTASTDTNAASLYGEVGYAFELPAHAASVTPFLSLNYDYVKMDGFADDGASGVGLTLDSMTVKQSTAQIGLGASVELWDRLHLEGSISRKEVFDRNAQHLTAAFQIDPTATYSIYGPSWGKSSNLFSLSLRGALTKSSSVFFSASRKYGDGTSFNSFAAGYRYSF